MKISSNQRGITHLVAIVVVLAIAAIGVVGWRVAQNAKDNTSTSSQTSITNPSTQVPEKLQSTADIKKADKALDNTGIDGDVNPSSLDSDLNSIL